MDTGREAAVTEGFSKGLDVPSMLRVVDTYPALDKLSLLGDILLSTRWVVLDGCWDDVPLFM